MKLANSLNKIKSLYSSRKATIVKNNLKRYWVLSLVYFILTFVCVPLAFLLNKSDGYAVLGYNDFKEMLMLNDIGIFIVFYTIIFSFVLALCLNKHMHNKDEMIFTHSLPMTKFDNFKYALLSFLKLLIMPLLLVAIIVALEKVVFGFTAFRYVHLLYFVFALVIVGLTTYAFTTLASSLSGTTVFSGLLTILFAFLPSIIYGVYALICSQFVGGYYVLMDHWEFVFRITPPIKFFMLSAEPFTWLSALLYVVASFAILYLSYLAYKYKKNEKTTETLVYNASKPILKYFITMLCIIPGFYEFASISRFNIYISILGGVVGIFIGYFAMEMIIQKNFFIWKNYKGFIYSVIAFFLIVLCIKVDIFGYTRYVPNVDKVEAVYFGEELYKNVRSRTLNKDGLVVMGELELTDEFVSDEQLINDTIEFHKILTKNNVSNFDKWGKDLEDGLICTKQIAYKLKNGKIVVREFNFKVDDLFDECYKVINNKELKRAHVKEFARLANSDDYIITGGRLENSALNSYFEIDDVEAKELLKLLCEDYINCDLSIGNGVAPRYYYYSFANPRFDVSGYFEDDYKAYQKLYNEKNYTTERVIDLVNYNLFDLPVIQYNYTNTINYMKKSQNLKYALFDKTTISYPALYRVDEDFESKYKEEAIYDYDLSPYSMETVESSLNDFVRDVVNNSVGLELSDDDLNKLLTYNEVSKEEHKYRYYLTYDLTQDLVNHNGDMYANNDRFRYENLDSIDIPTEFKLKLEELNSNVE